MTANVGARSEANCSAINQSVEFGRSSRLWRKVVAIVNTPRLGWLWDIQANG